MKSYFQLNRVAKYEKLYPTEVCLESKALNWFQWMEIRTPVCTWEAFKKKVMERFQTSQEGNGYSDLWR